ncbi:hypothetical protein CC80DRAFT_594926 [Byssothecium circinans]|uniref:Uncharacterized protein n=1 Tax=Byssothecium circinans TaxID=147558 RepID=A0A6A5TRZ4_9PLEO|nr:hypothetical protein CC80DRAFT_594926 [Byssothecium circinans]
MPPETLSQYPLFWLSLAPAITKRIHGHSSPSSWPAARMSPHPARARCYLEREDSRCRLRCHTSLECELSGPELKTHDGPIDAVHPTSLLAAGQRRRRLQVLYRAHAE